jgi:hypothetical protein
MQDSSNTPAGLPTVKGYVFVRELGNRPVPVYAAYVDTKGRRIDAVVVQRFVRDKSIHDEDVVDFTRAARALASVKPPHIVPLREVVIDRESVSLVGEFADGESLASLWMRSRDMGLPMPLEIAAQIVCDVLMGLHELHQLKDGKGAHLALVHGELAPGNVLVQTDGTAKLMHACRSKWVALKVPSSVGFLAPELLLQEGPIDTRADLYSAGSILFEAMTGAPPFPPGKVSSVIRKLTSGPAPRVAAPKDAPWSKALEGVVAKAMSIDRSGRYGSALEMRDAVQEATKSHVATDAHVAAWVARMAGNRILDRRKELAPPGTPRSRSQRPPPVAPREVEAPNPAPAPAPTTGLEAKLPQDPALLPVPMPAEEKPATAHAEAPAAVPVPIIQVGEPSAEKPFTTVQRKPTGGLNSPPVPGPAPAEVNLFEPVVPFAEPPRADSTFDEIDVAVDSVVPEPLTPPVEDSRRRMSSWAWVAAGITALVMAGAAIWLTSRGVESSTHDSEVLPSVLTSPLPGPTAEPTAPVGDLDSGMADVVRFDDGPTEAGALEAASNEPPEAEVTPKPEVKPKPEIKPRVRPKVRPKPASTYDPSGI